MYHNILKVVRHGLPVSQELRGDLIIFPHSGPSAAKDSLRTRLAWLLGEIKVVLVGPEGSRDALAHWPELRRVLQIRPEVIYNHIRVRSRFDLVFRIEEAPSKLHEPHDELAADGLLSLACIEQMCQEANITDTLIETARFIQAEHEDEHHSAHSNEAVIAQDAETLLHRHMNDIADIRKECGTFSTTSVSS